MGTPSKAASRVEQKIVDLLDDDYNFGLMHAPEQWRDKLAKLIDDEFGEAFRTLKNISELSDTTVGNLGFAKRIAGDALTHLNA